MTHSEPAERILYVDVFFGTLKIAFVQERQAVDALSAFLPPTAQVVRDRARCEIAAADLVREMSSSSPRAIGAARMPG